MINVNLIHDSPNDVKELSKLAYNHGFGLYLGDNFYELAQFGVNDLKWRSNNIDELKQNLENYLKLTATLTVLSKDE